MFDLSGRVALVTGAGQGVGAGIAKTLARRGAIVVVSDLYEERALAVAQEIQTAGGETVASAFDVTDPDAVRGEVHRLERSLGRIDVLVNNAGIPASGMQLRSFRDMDPSEWRRFVDLNLFGVLHCVHAALGGMCARGFGRIVTISSEAGRVGMPFGVSLYGAAKAAAVGFTRHLAMEVGPSGVTANCLSLGPMDNIPAPIADAIVGQLPLRRVGKPEDVGAAVAYLASDEAGWITGQVLPVNGGAAT
ncbi:MAG: short-chain dehydrogenase [Proteobacteria bacterium]|nr:MAG: short-chain dehydrogenase [Pseudomonadota bacterium]